MPESRKSLFFLKIPRQDNENNENLIIQLQNNENHEIHKIPLQNQETCEN